MKSLYLTNRFFIVLSIVVVTAVVGHFFAVFVGIAIFMLLTFTAIALFDVLLLFYTDKHGISITRQAPERLSNGDQNTIAIYVKSNYTITVNCLIIDELPFQFQIRNFEIKTDLNANEDKVFYYHLRPTARGEYSFGKTLAYITTKIGLIERRFNFGEPKTVPVYPSFMQMRKYELMAISNRLTEVGIKKIRRISNTHEFEQIKQYVIGDDYRLINWNATARKSQLMVNQYQDEKSQQVYSLIDMGRTMKMPFDGMTLLDYAINASLVISNIALIKQDKVGLLSFTNQINSLIPASKKNNSMQTILQVLYNQSPNFVEANYELLYVTVSKKITQRSLLLLYTNFEGLPSLNLQLPYLKKLARHHLVVVIFFENTEIKKVSHNAPKSTEEIYFKTIAEKLIFEKKQIVKELNNAGIQAVLTEPQHLTVNTINKYLELKARGLI